MKDRHVPSDSQSVWLRERVATLARDVKNWVTSHKTGYRAFINTIHKAMMKTSAR